MAGTLRKLKKSLSLKISFHSDSNPQAPSNFSTHHNATSSSAPRPSSSSSSSSSSYGSRLSRSISFQSSKKTCAICLASLRPGQGQAIFTAECSHTFHFNCIASNVKHGNHLCPICRSEWKDIPFHAPTNTVESRRNGMGRARVSPYNVPPEDIYAAGVHRNRQLQLPHQLEPDHFSDDEPLPAISAGPTSPSHPQAVTVKAFPEFPAISASDFLPKFPVLVRISAPSLRDDAHSLDRAPIDLVTVLDISSSMAGKLALLKRAVSFIIQNLGPADRLSIVAFSSSARRILPLRRMTDSGREDAIHAINSLSSNGGTNIVQGLKKGVRVLEERHEHNPVASIILLSDGQDTHNVDIHTRHCGAQNQASSNLKHKLEYLNLLPASICPSNSESGDGSLLPTFPVHTFGFGLEHDSIAMHAISDASGGTFSFIESVGILQDAFARCIGGLLSVVAQDVRLTIRSISPGVQIGSIPSGKYKSNIFNEGKQAVIDVGNLYADEEKEFLVYLSIPVSSAANCEKKLENTSLVDVVCLHKDSVSMEMVQVEGERVDIRRPEVLSPTDKIVCLEVDRQRSRLLVAETIADAQGMAETGNLEGAQAVLAEQRSALLSSASAQAGDGLCNWLEAELREIRERMASVDLYEQTGRAYVLSGLSSHSWQRATTRTQTFVMSREGGNSSTDGTIGYETPSMVNMVSKSQILNSAPAEQSRRLNKSCSMIQRRE